MFNLTSDNYWMIICVINVFLFLEQIICNINYVESNHNIARNKTESKFKLKYLDSVFCFC